VTVTRPDGTATPVLLTPDPGASDPSVPLEQSFSAEIEAGETDGELVVTLALDDASGEPRIVTRLVPIVAP
jgi:hypothetical protein